MTQKQTLCRRREDTVFFNVPPSVREFAAVGGKKESEGPLKNCFDAIYSDTSLGEKCWEKSEAQLQRRCVEILLKKTGLSLSQIDAVFAGDLQSQCTASGYCQRGLDVPFVGLYGACSTMAESLGVSACFAAGGFVENAIALTSSHFCSAERQFRTPLDYGGQRTPTAQWTVTASGGCVVSGDGDAPYIKSVTFGRVRDMAVTDINNMGAAMAPAAANTLLKYFSASGEKPESFDYIYTGDLGMVGSKLFLQLLEKEGVTVKNHKDCGLMIYDLNDEDVKSGASGCGCGASVLCGCILPQVRAKKQNRILFMATGALMSTTTSMEGESIPSIAHLVEIASSKE